MRKRRRDFVGGRQTNGAKWRSSLLCGASVGAFILGGTLSGCGSASSPSTQSASAVNLRIDWPETTRLVPAATQSVQVEVLDSAGFRTYRVANRPTSGNFSTLIFFGLTPGNVDFAARAFAAPDAQGVVIASAFSQITLSAGAQTNLSLVLSSTIERIELSSTRLSLARGASQTLTATARNSAGSIVPLTAAQTAWTSRDTGIATVDSSGRVVGVAAGSTVVVFKDNESGRSESALVVVSNASVGG